MGDVAKAMGRAGEDKASVGNSWNGGPDAGTRLHHREWVWKRRVSLRGISFSSAERSNSAAFFPRLTSAGLRGEWIVSDCPLEMIK
ncbi:hypothetical protein Y1Q_0003586 [Alligator mississippiensis]|uniref:Uncharacterized protein n=1 Tax=Alligator mississippiensis TaxID=8496 RepID=A0A151NGE1_ALLMI|nr:hypothetical protein Y1Q_0003586 [Alligator mississippiensis]